MVLDAEFSDILVAYLEKCGCSKRSIHKYNLETRLYHDLRIYGDVAEGFIEVLSGEFGVDISDFYFHAYFPVECPSKTFLGGILMSLTPHWIRRRYVHPDKQFRPLTLRMIQTALIEKRWVEHVDTRGGLNT